MVMNNNTTLRNSMLRDSREDFKTRMGKIGGFFSDVYKGAKQNIQSGRGLLNLRPHTPGPQTPILPTRQESTSIVGSDKLGPLSLTPKVAEASTITPQQQFTPSVVPEVKPTTPAYPNIFTPQYQIPEARQQLEPTLRKPIEPSTEQKAIQKAEELYLKSLEISPEELKTQKDLDRLIESTKKAYTGIKDQAIPMTFITGQLASLEERALNLAEPLEAKLARLQAKRTSAMEASKFALERADTKAETAREGFTLGKDQTRWEYDPNTLSYKQVAGDEGTGIPAVYQQGANRTVDSYVDGILSGVYKLSDVPKEYKDLVVQATAGQVIQPEISEYQREKTTRILNSIEELLPRVSGKTVGFGSLAGIVPGSAARDFRADLDTLKASIAFGELTAMREASKTGGALGQVSERELGLLESALGALDQGQSIESFTSNLNQIKESLNRWNQAQMQYGGTSQLGGVASGSNVFAEEW